MIEAEFEILISGLSTSKEQNSYSNQTSIMVVNITAESVIKLMATLDISLQSMTVAGHSEYKVTRKSM